MARFDRARAARLLPLGVALVAGVLIAVGSAPPRVRLDNTAMEIVLPPARGFAALVLGLAWLAAAWRVRRRALRLALAAAALVALFMGADLLLFRVRVDDLGIATRGALGSSRLAWTEVTRVESGSWTLVIWGRGDEQVRVRVRRWGAQTRATLERAIARRVREAAERRPGR